MPWTVHVGRGRAQVALPCSRCKIPTTDQATGVAGSASKGKGGGFVDPEPTRTLKAYRTGRKLNLPNPKVAVAVAVAVTVVVAAAEAKVLLLASRAQSG